MNARPKPTYGPNGHFSGGFDAKLKEAIARVKGITALERVKLYGAIVDVCKTQVEDCCDSITAAIFLALHDDHGFGQKRINRLREHSQRIVDEHVARYDIATLESLYRDLRERRIVITPRTEDNR